MIGGIDALGKFICAETLLITVGGVFRLSLLAGLGRRIPGLRTKEIGAGLMTNQP
jgi:hypothetical protein